jgi:hypothetical protein
MAMAMQQLDPDEGERAPWDRQPAEGSKAYAAFLRYRELGPDRSIPKVCQQYAEYARSIALLKRWSVRNHWLARAAAWDLDQRRHRDAALRLARERAVQRQERAGGALLTMGMRLLTPPPRLTGAAREDWTPSAKDLHAATHAIVTGIEQQRLSMGLPTRISSQSVIMKQAVSEALAGQKILVALRQEHLCNDCRERIGDEYDRVLAYHRALEGQLD